MGENGERIGLFVSSADRNALRLKVGEDHKGWVLRELVPLKAALGKGQQSVVLELTRRDMGKGGSVPAPPPAPLALPNKTGGVVGEAVAISNAKLTGGISPLREPPAVVPITIVQPPAAAEPQVNPFEGAWRRDRSR